MNFTDGEFAAVLRGNAMVSDVTDTANNEIRKANAAVRALQAEVIRLQAQVAQERAGRLFAEGQLARARRH